MYLARYNSRVYFIDTIIDIYGLLLVSFIERAGSERLSTLGSVEIARLELFETCKFEVAFCCFGEELAIVKSRDMKVLGPRSHPFWKKTFPELEI